MALGSGVAWILRETHRHLARATSWECYADKAAGQTTAKTGTSSVMSHVIGVNLQLRTFRWARRVVS